VRLGRLVVIELHHPEFHTTMRRFAARWTRLALDNSPSARSSHGISAIAGAAYLYGGEGQARHAIDSTVHRLDMQSHSWEALAPAHAPPPRVAHAQAAVGGKLLVFGGLIGDGRSSDEVSVHLNDCWSFDPKSVEWTKLEPARGTPPCARSYHRAAAVGDTLFIFGGCGADGRLADLHAFDTKTCSWSEVPPPPELRGRGGATFEASADGSRLWVCAGFAGEETNDLMCFDLAERAWTRVEAPWLRKRSVAASMSLEMGVVIFGGEVSPSDKGHEGAGGFASDLIGFESAAGSQLEVSAACPPSPSPRGWGAAAAIGPDEGVVFGGLAGDDSSPERLGDAWHLKVSEE